MTIQEAAMSQVITKVGELLVEHYRGRSAVSCMMDIADALKSYEKSRRRLQSRVRSAANDRG